MTYWDKASQEQRLDANGWQDISTAPKDGTEILGFGPAMLWGRSYAPGRHVCWWDQENECWQGRDPSDNLSLRITHWHHLPKPPSNPFNALLPEPVE